MFSGEYCDRRIYEWRDGFDEEEGEFVVKFFEGVLLLLGVRFIKIFREGRIYGFVI